MGKCTYIKTELTFTVTFSDFTELLAHTHKQYNGLRNAKGVNQENVTEALDLSRHFIIE